MRFRIALSLLAAGAVVLSVGQAQAADTLLNPEPIANQGDDIIIWVGGGIQVQPDYVGSDDYELQPLILIDPERIRFQRFQVMNSERHVGFSIGPSFGFVGGRDEDDNAALQGLGDVDFTFELGLRARYEAEFWRVFVAGRYGLGGHEGFVGDIGADVILNVTPNLRLTAGPRARFGDDNFYDAYFAVSPEQAAASVVGLPVFDPDPGIHSVGIEAELIYQINEDWRAHLRGGYDRLVGDAEDSPIVAIAGDEDQFHIGFGVAYRLAFDLFD
ncbi:MAG: MipA/OmpV family protein [Pseudomonadota bacterium]